ncbi:outer membrane beta-barrel protein [Robertkochia aurantiaca]|uniref:outer membrane beta-barrel protein n=1 Tax=Robertkochia aurantiaca TaxID=2873700 RepID=UPI001CC924D8|nr:outer membrane beta-barrel protein [Robertkochia sp. 3YJGBD-33]
MKHFITAALLLFGFAVSAQSGSGFGIKGGLNFSSNGTAITDIGENISEIGSDTQTGFHLGVFAKLGGEGLFYFRPELIYTKTNSNYDSNNLNADLSISKLDVPALVGLNLIGPLHIFAGPSFQLILDTDLEDIELEDAENDFTVGLHFGAGVNLGKWGVDLRYERGLSSNEAEFAGLNEGRVDTRPSQLILSAAYKFF